MTNIYELNNRVLIPNWRDFRRTVKLGELSSNFGNRKINFDISKIKLEWNLDKNIGIAADLISSSFVSNDFSSRELEEAIDYIQKNKNDSSQSLLSLISRIREESKSNRSENTKILEKNIETVEEFKSILNDRLLNKIIAKTKQLTKEHLQNSISWVELARLYTIRNQIEKAGKCITIALQLAPNNRFVLRAAVRFFVHIKEEERALFYLRKSEATAKDPWLVSAHIAASTLIGRYPTVKKIGEKMVSSGHFSDFDLTELASSLGSLEFMNGTFKKSRPLLDLSIKAPNDNSLAQFEWLSKRESRLVFDSRTFHAVKNPFEAFAYGNFLRGDFREAFYNCLDWFLDFPYSKRPLVFGSYIASLFDEYDSMIVLCLVGLKVNGRDPLFLNNIIYAYCMKNDLTNASKYVDMLSANLFEAKNGIDDRGISLRATLGLYFLRNGEMGHGIRFYQEALEVAKESKDEYYYNLALINLTRELYLLKHDDFSIYYSLFQNIKAEEPDIGYLKKKIQLLIETHSSGD